MKPSKLLNSTKALNSYSSNLFYPSKDYKFLIAQKPSITSNCSWYYNSYLYKQNRPHLDPSPFSIFKPSSLNLTRYNSGWGFGSIMKPSIIINSTRIFNSINPIIIKAPRIPLGMFTTTPSQICKGKWCY